MWPVGFRMLASDLTQINKYCNEFDVDDGRDRITMEFLKQVRQLAVLNITAC